MEKKQSGCECPLMLSEVAAKFGGVWPASATRHLTRYGDVLSDFCRQILSLQLSVTKVLTRTVVKDCSAFRCCLGYRKQRKDEGKLLIFLMQST